MLLVFGAISYVSRHLKPLFKNRENRETFQNQTASTERTLFLTTEATGITEKDAAPLPDLSQRFDKAIIVYLTVSHINIRDFFASATKWVKNAGINKVEYWLQLDTTKVDDITCSNFKMPEGLTDCTLEIGTILDDNQQQAGKKYPIAGLYFDYEGLNGPNQPGGIDIIVQSMEQVAEKQGLKLGFTKSIKTCAQKCPHPAYCKKDWDHCLGQSYTDTTAKLYQEDDGKTLKPCGEVNGAAVQRLWTTNTADNGMPLSYNVPLLCLGGNCQGDMPGYLMSHGSSCNIDERLSTDGFANMLKEIDATKFPNIGVWYGNNSSSANSCPARCK